MYGNDDLPELFYWKRGSMSALQELLKRTPVITDGAWGTQIQNLGLEAGGCPDAWNLIKPAAVEQVARSYVEAGSRIVLTNTFGANRIMLERHGLADEAVDLNRAGAILSRRAAGDNVFVFGSIGPAGRLLVMGEIDRVELADAFEEQASALADGGVHGIIVETMSDLEEARVAVAAAKETGLPVVASMVYDAGKEFDRTMMGVTVEEAVAGLTDAGADVLGANCGMGVEFFENVTRRLRAATTLPIWIKPNAGLPEMIGSDVVYKTTPDEFASYAVGIRDAGAQFIGGCCGTTPDFIRALVQKCAQS
jgi:5-methyltetrahydrofolate--homocysteine methyltransferase